MSETTTTKTQEGTMSERNSQIVFFGDRISVTDSKGSTVTNCTYQDGTLAHARFGQLRFCAEITAQLDEAAATARTPRWETVRTTPADTTGWEYLGISDDSGDYQPIYQRKVDAGLTTTVHFGPADVLR